MRGRCEKKHGKGNCQKQGLIFYAKCKSGCNNIGLICRPKQLNCKKLGLGGQLDLSCAKKVRIGNPKTGICNSRQEEDAGLFYKNCKSGYDGDGPVCWADKPKGWVNCGMVAAVGVMALFIGSFGTSSAGKLAKLKKNFATMKKAFDKIKDTPKMKKAIERAQNGNRVRKGFNAGKTLALATTEEDMVRAEALIAAIADPTGVSSMVAAYTYPKCSKYFGPVKPNEVSFLPPEPMPGLPGQIQVQHASGQGRFRQVQYRLGRRENRPQKVRGACGALSSSIPQTQRRRR